MEVRPEPVSDARCSRCYHYPMVPRRIVTSLSLRDFISFYYRFGGGKDDTSQGLHFLGGEQMVRALITSESPGSGEETKVERKEGGWDDLPLLKSGITIHPNYGLTLGSTVHCTAGIGPSIAGIWALFMEFREQVVPAFSEFLHLPMHSVELVRELVPFSAPFLPELPPTPTPLWSCNSVGANDTVS